jgi:thymidylate synthase (FAD)
MVDIVMEIETTRDIARQILRHRSFSFQEFSQRYADPTKDLGFVTREARLQDTKNRQNSIETDDENLQEVWDEWQAGVLDEARIAYAWAIDNGIAKEQARAVLPEGLTKSRMYMKGSLRSWIHYCQVRMDPSTQKEHREIATMAWDEIVKIFPSLTDVLQQETK